MRHNNIRHFLAITIMIGAIACTETKINEEETPRVDSMPVITPHSSDTDAILNPPPTNDKNVILPDSQIRTQ